MIPTDKTDIALCHYTIDRCAQVAEEKLKEHSGPYGCGPYTRAAIKSVIRAIRVLKDKP
jgi:hypothetical protein